MDNIIPNIDGKIAVRIAGRVKKTTKQAAFVDCDGDNEWFPLACIRDNKNGTVDIQEWSFKLKFPNG